MKIHLIDGTYELFRAYFAMPKLQAPDGREVGAIRGLIQTLLLLTRQNDVSHIGCAFDHVVESFRNDLFDGYKTGEGVPDDLRIQFDIAERAVSALGIVVWPMIEFEADDAIATVAARWKDSPEVDQVVICSPDKDLMQMVQGSKVVSLDRRRDTTTDDLGVKEKFGVSPESIPDYLALVGDAADGIPGIPRWGAKSASTVLSEYISIENIPRDPAEWTVKVRGAKSMADNLSSQYDNALLYKRLATLRIDVPIIETLDDLKWRGVRRSEFELLCEELGFSSFVNQIVKWDEA